MSVSFEICDNVVTKYTGDNSSFVIPNSCIIDGINTKISIIKESMFKCCRSIENIEIEEGIKTIEKEAFSAIGYCIIPPEEIKSEEYGAYWKKIDFTKYPAYPENLEDFGEVAAWIHPTENNGELSYFFGFETNCETVPDGFFSITVPKAEYAVFEAEVSVFDENLSEELNRLWKHIFDEWFPVSGKKFDEGKMCFEFYKGEKAYIYVPIK